MVPLLARPPNHETDEHFKALLKQRSRPYVVVLDVGLNIAFAEPDALALLETHFWPYRPTCALPAILYESVGVLIGRRSRDHGAVSEALVGSVKGLVFRVVPLFGLYRSFYAIFFEKEARREDLKEAVTRFSLTPREVEVLDLILRGMNAAEIAEDLHIAEVTVFDHFKHISHKTNARNRADMVAKIFNWQAALTMKGASSNA